MTTTTKPDAITLRRDALPKLATEIIRVCRPAAEIHDIVRRGITAAIIAAGVEPRCNPPFHVRAGTADEGAVCECGEIVSSAPMPASAGTEERSRCCGSRVEYPNVLYPTIPYCTACRRQCAIGAIRAAQTSPPWSDVTALTIEVRDCEACRVVSGEWQGHGLCESHAAKSATLFATVLRLGPPDAPKPAEQEHDCKRLAETDPSHPYGPCKKGEAPNVATDTTEADTAPDAPAPKVERVCRMCGAYEDAIPCPLPYCPAATTTAATHMWMPRSYPVPPAEPDQLQLVSAHPETTCERCHGPNVWSWHAPSPLWNAVVRDQAHGYGIVCPTCFAEMVEMALGRLVWCFKPHDLDVSSLWTDSEGRTWDAERCLWVDAAPAEPERIVGPAFRATDGHVWWEPTPASHYSVSQRMIAEGIERPLARDEFEQGFWTSRDRFVRRKPAKRIAEAAGQIVNPISGSADLFSEELWREDAEPEREGPVCRDCGIALVRPDERGTLDNRCRECKSAPPVAQATEPVEVVHLQRSREWSYPCGTETHVRNWSTRREDVTCAGCLAVTEPPPSPAATPVSKGEGLALCPFCGHRADTWSYTGIGLRNFRVGCTGCGAGFEASGTNEKIIAAWQRRAAPPLDAPTSEDYDRGWSAGWGARTEIPGPCESPMHWFRVDVPADGGEKCACGQETLMAPLDAQALAEEIADDLLRIGVGTNWFRSHTEAAQRRGLTNWTRAIIERAAGRRS